MTTYAVGDPLGECANAKCDGSVVYNGGTDASCVICKATYSIELEEGEQAEAPPPPPPPPPPPAPVALVAPPPPPIVPEARPQVQPVVAQEPEFVEAPVSGIDGPTTAEPVVPVVDDDYIGTLVEAVAGTPAARKKQLVLDENAVGISESDASVDLPGYVKRSRPWKWAQAMSRTGNPYRQNCKSWVIFNIFHEHERTLEAAVEGYVVDGNDITKMSFLLTIYEVVTQCVAAGLLIIDPETRIIGVCKGQPQVTPMP